MKPLKQEVDTLIKVYGIAKVLNAVQGYAKERAKSYQRQRYAQAWTDVTLKLDEAVDYAVEKVGFES
jgi:hypothetical protein